MITRYFYHHELAYYVDKLDVFCYQTDDFN